MCCKKYAVMEQQIIELVFIYGGYWRLVLRRKRKRYECGKQKTRREVVDNLSMDALVELVADYYPSSCGKKLKLRFAMPQSYEKIVKGLKTEDDLKKFLRG